MDLVVEVLHYEHLSQLSTARRDFLLVFKVGDEEFCLKLPKKSTNHRTQETIRFPFHKSFKHKTLTISLYRRHRTKPNRYLARGVVDFYTVFPHHVFEGNFSTTEDHSVSSSFSYEDWIELKGLNNFSMYLWVHLSFKKSLGSCKEKEIKEEKDAMNGVTSSLSGDMACVNSIADSEVEEPHPPMHTSRRLQACEGASIAQRRASIRKSVILTPQTPALSESHLGVRAPERLLDDGSKLEHFEAQSIPHTYRTDPSSSPLVEAEPPHHVHQDLCHTAQKTLFSLPIPPTHGVLETLQKKESKGPHSSRQSLLPSTGPRPTAHKKNLTPHMICHDSPSALHPTKRCDTHVDPQTFNTPAQVLDSPLPCVLSPTALDDTETLPENTDLRPSTSSPASLPLMSSLSKEMDSNVSVFPTSNSSTSLKSSAQVHDFPCQRKKKLLQYSGFGNTFKHLQALYRRVSKKNPSLVSTTGTILRSPETSSTSPEVLPPAKESDPTAISQCKDFFDHASSLGNPLATTNPFTLDLKTLLHPPLNQIASCFPRDHQTKRMSKTSTLYSNTGSPAEPFREIRALIALCRVPHTLTSPHQLMTHLRCILAFLAVTYHWRFNPQHIKVATSSTDFEHFNVTQAELIQGFQWLMNQEYEGDHLILYYQGQGSDGPSIKNPIFTTNEGAKISLRQLYTMVHPRHLTSRPLTCFLDCIALESGYSPLSPSRPHSFLRLSTPSEPLCSFFNSLYLCDKNIKDDIIVSLKAYRSPYQPEPDFPLALPMAHLSLQCFPHCLSFAAIHQRFCEKHPPQCDAPPTALEIVHTTRPFSLPQPSSDSSTPHFSPVYPTDTTPTTQNLQHHLPTCHHSCTTLSSLQNQQGLSPLHHSSTQIFPPAPLMTSQGFLPHSLSCTCLNNRSHVQPSSETPLVYSSGPSLDQYYSSDNPSSPHYVNSQNVSSTSSPNIRQGYHHHHHHVFVSVRQRVHPVYRRKVLVLPHTFGTPNP